jgi:nucleotide-binding universal stress UspA family protein
VYRTIVVGCDGSRGADEALALAQQLLEPDAGRLILVSAFSVYRGFAGVVTPFVYAEWLKERAEEDLQHAAERLASDVRYEKQTIAAGSAAEGLDDIAITVHADLIVVGPTHRSKLGTLGGRSTAQRLLHGAPCAVAVAADDQDRRSAGLARIAVAYDGSAEAEHALDTAFALATPSRATVRLCTALEQVVYVTGYAAPLPDPGYDRQREQQALASLEAAAARAPDGVDVETRIGWGQASKTVLELAGPDADLVVAGSRGYGPMHRVLAGSASIGLLTHGDVPVLVTPRILTGSAAESTAASETETS